jgi:uncharacterized membrane protein YdbT with pleckstrin-like domain
MGYIENNLISGESVTYRARLHWIVLLKSAIVSLLLVGMAALLFYIRSSSAGSDGSDAMAILVWIAGGILIVAAIPIGSAELKRRAAEFAVTNKRVILKVGAVTNKTAEMFLNKIESVGVEQTLMGRVLGYGTIVIRGTGGSLEPFHLIAAPLEYRKQIQEQIGKTFEPVAKSSRDL